MRSNSQKSLNFGVPLIRIESASGPLRVGMIKEI